MRILFYSPDSYGLGHVRRTISLAESVLEEFTDSSALVVTGAPRAHYFDYPPRCDYVKLPSVTKGADGRYVSGEIDLSLKKTVRLRSALIREAATSFRPHVVMVDHAPRGLCGEVLPVLEVTRRRSDTLRILGMRDVIDEAAAVRSAWNREGVIEILRNFYDLVLVFGIREIFDPVSTYEIPPDVASKFVFTGYISRTGKGGDASALRQRFARRTGHLVVVTLGGGGDGDVLLRAFLDGYETLGGSAPFDVVAITGPLMSPGKRARFQARAEAMPGLTLLEHASDLPLLLEASDFVVSMGGYNTICELACAGARALVVPRTFPRGEQLVRCRFLAERGVLRYLVPEQATPEALMLEVMRGLRSDRPRRGWGLDFEGLKRSVEHLKRLRNRSSGTSTAPFLREATR